MPRAHNRELKVGLLVLAALAVLAIGLLVIGDRSNFFVRKTSYFVRFTQVGGLAPGAGVTLDGVNVGTVSQIFRVREAWDQGTSDDTAGAANWTERTTGVPWSTAGAGARRGRSGSRPSRGPRRGWPAAPLRQRSPARR